MDQASSCQFPNVASQLMSPLLLPGPLWTTPQSSWSPRSVGGHLLPLCSCGASRLDLELREGEFLALAAPCPPQSCILCLASPPNPGPRLSLGFPHVQEHGPAPPQPDKSLPSSEALLNQVGISQKQTNRRAQSCGFQSSDSSVCLSQQHAPLAAYAGWTGPQLRPQAAILEAWGCPSSLPRPCKNSRRLQPVLTRKDVRPGGSGRDVTRDPLWGQRLVTVACQGLAGWAGGAGRVKTGGVWAQRTRQPTEQVVMLSSTGAGL